MMTFAVQILKGFGSMLLSNRVQKELMSHTVLVPSILLAAINCQPFWNFGAVMASIYVHFLKRMIVLYLKWGCLTL